MQLCKSCIQKMKLTTMENDYMLEKQFYVGNITLNISTYINLKRKLKSLTGEQKKKLNTTGMI